MWFNLKHECIIITVMEDIWSVRKISLYQFPAGFIWIRLRDQAHGDVEKLGG